MQYAITKKNYQFSSKDCNLDPCRTLQQWTAPLSKKLSTIAKLSTTLRASFVWNIDYFWRIFYQFLLGLVYFYNNLHNTDSFYIFGTTKWSLGKSLKKRVPYKLNFHFKERMEKFSPPKIWGENFPLKRGNKTLSTYQRK